MSVLMRYVAIWYVSIRYEGEGRTASSSSFILITTGRIETYQIATYSIRTLMKMDYWSPKHVELLNVMNKINHQILCTLFDYRYKTKFCLTVVQAHHSNRHGPKLITPRFWYISKIQISHKFLQKFQRLNTSRNRPRVQHTTDCAFIFLISPPSTNLHTTPPPKKKHQNSLAKLWPNRYISQRNPWCSYLISFFISSQGITFASHLDIYEIRKNSFKFGETVQDSMEWN